MMKLFSTTTVDILRHGECEGGNIFRGSTDVLLTNDGFASMRNACHKAKCKWDIIISSPLLRCRRFSEHLGQEMDIPWEIDDRLREMSFGDWDGKRIDKIENEYPDHIRTWSKDPTAFTPPNAENIQVLNQRIDECRIDIQDRHSGKHLLLVTHGGVFRVLMAQVQGIPLENISNIEVPYACLSRYLAHVFKKGTCPDTNNGAESCTEKRTKLFAHNFVLL